MEFSGAGGLQYRVGRRLAQLRRSRGWTQERLAVALDLATKNLQRIEAGRQNLTLESLDRIAAVLELPAESLLAPPGRLAAPRSTLEEAALFGPLSRAGLVVHRAGSEAASRPGLVPLLGLEAAVEALLAAVAPVAVAYVELPEDTRESGPGWFVAPAVGDSMEPRIRADTFCLFRPPGEPYPIGCPALVHVPSFADPDTGDAYGLKSLAEVSSHADGGVRVVLASDNRRRYAPKVLKVYSPRDLRVLAEVVGVLTSPVLPGVGGE